MSQLSLSLDSSLLVRDDQGRYLPATADQILEAARYVIDQKTPRGTLFTSPALVKDYLRTKLANFEHEVFATLFLDSQNRLIEYVEMFRGTIDQASVYPREVVKTALQHNAAAVIFSHNHPSGNSEPSQADKLLAGAAPLMVGSGAGAEIRQVMGVTVFAGMLGVTLFGLFLTPVFYVALRRLATRKPRRQANVAMEDTHV